MKRVLSILLCFAMTLSLCGCSRLDYKKAVMLYESGAYESAKEIFDALGDYEDSAGYAARAGQIIDYRIALELYAGENWAEAAEKFDALDDYEGSKKYLAKCRDEIMAEKIVGTWETEPVDLTNLLKAVIQQEMEALGYYGLSYDDVESISVVQTYSFEDYGVVKTSFTDESFGEFLRVMVQTMKSTMLAVSGQELIYVAEQYGVSYEEVLSALGVSSVQEYLESSLGMSLDELFSLYFGEDSMIDFAALSSVSGVWYVQDGKLCAIVGEEREEAEYDFDSDTITMVSNSLEEFQHLYPYSLTRADEQKPNA